MSGTLSVQAAELFPNGVNETKYLVAAGVLFAGSVLLDKYTSRRDNTIEERTNEDETRLGLADPYIAEQLQFDNRRTRIAEKAGYYAAVLTATFATVHFGAKPFNSHPHLKGDASVVIESGYAADVQDMQDSNGTQMSRLQASITGSINAASHNNVPFSFILDGSTSVTADTTPAQSKNLSQTRKKVNAILKPNFRNGDSLANGIQDAVPLSGTQPNNIIIVGSNLDPQAISGIQEVQAQIRSSGSKDTLSAVVVGNSDSTKTIGVATINAPVNPQSFQNLLGTNNVKTAKTSGDVDSAITSLLSRSQASANKKSNNDAGYLAAAFAALGLGVGLARRLSGLPKQLFKKRGEI